MALRKILLDKDETLRKTSRPVTTITPRVLTLLDDMKDTLYDAQGVGLAAPQVGVLRRIVVIDAGDGLVELINPVMIEKSGKQDGQEGCLSFPTRWGMVVRPMNVKVKALDRHGKQRVYEAKELFARALCHEIDHLNGKLFVDVMYKEIFDNGK